MEVMLRLERSECCDSVACPGQLAVREHCRFGRGNLFPPWSSTHYVGSCHLNKDADLPWKEFQLGWKRPFSVLIFGWSTFRTGKRSLMNMYFLCMSSSP